MSAPLAIDGGSPVRDTVLPYARQSIDDADVQSVVETLQSDWLTTGPRVAEFEAAFAQAVDAPHAVALNSGTAALHTAMHMVGVGPGDEVLVPAMTFCASANAVVYQGATPVFVDVEPETLLIDLQAAAEHITDRTKAIVTVDYAGQACDYTAIRALAQQHQLPVIADACHALGGSLANQPVGSLADISCFSFHPVKPLATGEGGMVTTADAAWAEAATRFRNHCITSDHRERHEQGSWFYEQAGLGYNYRLTDIQCALGLSQLPNIPAWTAKRQAIATQYDAALSDVAGVQLLTTRADVSHAYHLYVVRLRRDNFTVDREQLFAALRAENIGVNVHYIPVHLHPYYREQWQTEPGLCPAAEAAYEEIISLPMFATMTEADVQDVIAAVTKVCTAYQT